MTSSNTTDHYLITDVETGEDFAEKCRHTPGGFHNLMKRLSAHFGVGEYGYEAVDADAGLWSFGGRHVIVARALVAS